MQLQYFHYNTIMAKFSKINNQQPLVLRGIDKKLEKNFRISYKISHRPGSQIKNESKTFQGTPLKGPPGRPLVEPSKGPKEGTSMNY